MMTVPVGTGRPIPVGNAQPLFALKPFASLLEVARDGRFLLLVPAGAGRGAPRSSSTQRPSVPAADERPPRLPPTAAKGRPAAPGPRWSARCGRRRKYAPPAFRC